jgi:hypothetical protein
MLRPVKDVRLTLRKALEEKYVQQDNKYSNKHITKQHSRSYKTDCSNSLALAASSSALSLAQVNLAAGFI